jgi:hypothetical protein
MATTPTGDPLVNSDRTVGVRPRLDFKSLKREALLFDQIAIQLLDTELAVSHGRRLREVLWLRDLGIIRDIPKRDYRHDPTEYLNAIAAETGRPIEPLAFDPSLFVIPYKQRVSASERQTLEVIRRLVDAFQTTEPDVREAISLRMSSMDLRRKGINAFPILETRRQIGTVFPSGTTPDTTPVLEVILKSMPIPDDQTPWEDIIEFRKDHDSMKRLRRLRVWVRKFAKDTTATSLAEMKEEIEVLLDEYEEHMKLRIYCSFVGTTKVFLSHPTKNTLQTALHGSAPNSC